MQIKLALFGTPVYSLIIFERLKEAGFPIAVVVTKPPRPIGRAMVVTPTPVAQWAKTMQIPLLTPDSDPEKPWKFKDETAVEAEILKFKPDLMITVDYTQFIPINLVKQIKFGGLNVHPSLLPAYRGPAPVPWAILNGETETGVSLVTLSEQFDTGQIVAQSKEPILTTDTTDTLLTRLFSKGAELLLDTLPKYLRSPTTCDIQPATKSSYFPRLTRDSGFEPWGKIKEAIETGIEAERIERKWRALHPWPGLWTLVKINSEDKRLKILKSNLLLTTYKLQLIEIQLEGKQPLSGKDAEVLIHTFSKLQGRQGPLVSK